MESIIELFKISIPAILVLYASFQTFKMYMNKEYKLKLLEHKVNNAETSYPLRLQAYERMVLFLERISPSNLVPRINSNNLTVSDLRHILLNEIKTEYNHNITQQIYMSDEAWNLVKNAMEELIVIINSAAKDLDPDETSMALAKRIFEEYLKYENDPLIMAISLLKGEVRETFL